MTTALYSPDDLAEKFGNGATRRWVLDQRIKYGWPSVKISGRIWFTEEHIDAIIAQHSHRPARQQKAAVVIEGQTRRSARRSA